MSWLACFALACQLLLSFGHVHLGQTSTKSFISSFLTGDGTKGDGSTQPSHKKPTGLTDEFCAVCNNLSLASTLIVPIAPAIEIPLSTAVPLPWSVAQAEPSGFAHSLLRTRGPPQA